MGLEIDYYSRKDCPVCGTEKSIVVEHWSYKNWNGGYTEEEQPCEICSANKEENTTEEK